MEVVTTAVRKSEEPQPEKKLNYRERILRLASEKGRPFDPEDFRTDLFDSDEELEAFIDEIYKHRRSYPA